MTELPVGDVKVDMTRVKARKDHVVGLSNRSIERGLRNLQNCRVYEAHARFVSPREVQAGGEVRTSERIFIDVSARAAVPDIPGLDQVHYLTNSSMMDVDLVPRHLLVLGGSYLGLEFGQMYRRFGSQVTIVELGPRLVSREDEDLSGAITGILAREGIAVRCNAKCLGIGKQGGDIAMTVDRGGTAELRGSYLPVATGRRPNTDDFGLDRAGVKRDERGYIVVDDALRTSTPGIRALGDCNGKGAFTHTSWNDHEIVVATLFDGRSRRAMHIHPTVAEFIPTMLGSLVPLPGCAAG
ncbi:MAG: FAD-dependent oxidoreductase [Acetobacteraceae bacterium]